MVDLAKQAFITNNFDLAAEIYERHIAENGPNADVFLGLADSYARARQLKKSFEAYVQAFRLRNIPYERLDNLVTALLDMMGNRDDAESQKKRIQQDPFACGSCLGLWNDPVTIQCGHTYCRPCLDKLNGKICKVCSVETRYSKIHAIRTNVLLAQTAESWFAEELAAVRIKAEGNKYFEQAQYLKAIELYSQAFNKASSDHLLVSNRSYAYACLNKYSEALQDAERCVSLRPDWPKGYFRKANALAGLSRHEEACLAFLQCLSLDPTITSARTALTRSLHKVLSPGLPEDVKRFELQQLLHPNPLLLLQNNPPPGVASHADAFNRALARVKNSLGSSNFPSPPASTQQPLRLDVSTEQSHRPVVKCSSESDLAEKSARSISEPSPLTSCRSCDSLSRKRSSTGNVDSGTTASSSGATSTQPNSPNKQTPSKHPKQTGSAFNFDWKPDDVVGTGNSNTPGEGASGESCMESGEEAATSESGETARLVIHRPVPQHLRNVENFECSLCMRLLFDAVTTPCGHTFCRLCLDRVLDHTPSCPLCKSTLTEYLAERRSSVTEAVTGILVTYFPQEFAERKHFHEEEISELNKGEEVPVFVCTMAYPRIPCPLHIYEPRYRLMVRQCMESGLRQFGMVVCHDTNEENYADYGTMLEIRDVQYFPDGRSVVDCIGGRRFKVRSRGHRHGYHTAKVEFLVDQAAETAEQQQEINRLHDETQHTANQWFQSLPANTQGTIVSHFGPVPALEPDALSLHSGPAWHWWLVAVLPLDPRAQLAIVAMTSLRERLRALQRVLQYANRRR